jgi:hypothetical protein
MFVQQFRQEKIRPHWAKRHTDIPGIVDVIKETYGDNIAKFHQMKFVPRFLPGSTDDCQKLEQGSN